MCCASSAPSRHLFFFLARLLPLVSSTVKFDDGCTSTIQIIDYPTAHLPSPATLPDLPAQSLASTMTREPRHCPSGTSAL